MRSFPWDSLNIGLGDDGFPIYDRDYMASDLREVYETFFSNGIFLDKDEALQVTAGEGMNVIVAPGKCCINGTIGYENSQRELAMQASSSQDRIDTVVLRWNANIELRNIDLYVKTGVASATPVAPNLTRSETVYELGIANIFVAKNSGAISAARITDTRLVTERCGIVTPFAKIDMTSFYEQMDAALKELEDKLTKQTQIAVDLAQNAIDGTTAGNLQSQITANKEEIDSLNERWDSQCQGHLLASSSSDTFEDVGKIDDYEWYVLICSYRDEKRVLASSIISHEYMFSGHPHSATLYTPSDFYSSSCKIKSGHLYLKVEDSYWGRADLFGVCPKQPT